MDDDLRKGALTQAVGNLKTSLLCRHPELSLAIIEGQLTQAVRRRDWLLAETALDLLQWLRRLEDKSNDNAL